MEDIMHYESKIWAIADLLLAASVKRSDFPAYMMPFFALTMLEGRMLNAINAIKEEEGITPEEDPEDFDEAFREKDCGYNRFIVMEGKTLRTICQNDTTFEQDFYTYLGEFDDTLKMLLGINRNKTEQKYLNMDGIVAELRGKKILMSVVSAWSEIDLSSYSNSDITTLEEHIKRKWADISASTAGEQYTPDDIISLIADIVASKVTKSRDQFIHVYDPTCGGANLLFGVADRLATQAGYRYIATYGSEYNDALYALAAIESRFRPNSKISYGNTLTTVPFAGTSFDVIVANPPYGTKWSGYQSEIKNDQKGQFSGGLPGISDGQLLFMQHILWQLDNEGIAVEVHNGSTLFSGNAGEGESNIRKYIFDHDWVEAIIQLTVNEFFNTPITTYLWIMNKNKPIERKDKIALIDASNLYTLLKKSKGDKRREMTIDHRTTIVDALTKFESSDICKIYSREHFYYNKQSLTLTDLDDDGRSVLDTICKDGKVKVNEGEYRFDEDRNTIVRTSDGEAVGCGKFTIKKRKDRKNGEIITENYIEPVYINDYEIIPHHFNQDENQREIDAFMQKYVFKPYKLGDNIIGVELNFNKEFYEPEVIDNTSILLQELKKLEEEMNILRVEISNVVTHGLNQDIPFKNSGIEWIGMIPEHWEMKRFKEFAKAVKGKQCEYYDEQGDNMAVVLTVETLRQDIPTFYNYGIVEDKNQLCSDQDIIIIWDGAGVGEFLKSKKGLLSSTTARIDVNEKIVLKRYLWHWRYGIEYRLKSVPTGMGIPHLNPTLLNNYMIPVPPLSEQQAIADYLDEKCAKIDAAIENISKQLDASKRLKKAIINEAICG